MPKTYNRYFEPFIGGGALFFDLQPKNAVINDYNSELANLYRVVKTDPKGLLDNACHHKNESDYYYNLRALDRNPKAFSKLTAEAKAGRFLYLNKTGFNGLYRVNSKGENNVPFGKYKNPNYCDQEGIEACSQALQDTTILEGDFEGIKAYVKKGDFIYFDPPYVPINTTSNFTSYTASGFDDDMQMRLKEFCDYLNGIGAYFMLSNSHTEFIHDLYHEYKIETVFANRFVNADASNRGKIKEVIVTNY
jgi:DNA adenine methylase